jgi:hypothetical protein
VDAEEEDDAEGDEDEDAVPDGGGVDGADGATWARRPWSHHLIAQTTPTMPAPAPAEPSIGWLLQEFWLQKQLIVILVPIWWIRGCARSVG